MVKLTITLISILNFCILKKRTKDAETGWVQKWIGNYLYGGLILCQIFSLILKFSYLVIRQNLHHQWYFWNHLFAGSFVLLATFASHYCKPKQRYKYFLKEFLLSKEIHLWSTLSSSLSWEADGSLWCWSIRIIRDTRSCFDRFISHIFNVHHLQGH